MPTVLRSLVLLLAAAGLAGSTGASAAPATPGWTWPLGPPAPAVVARFDPPRGPYAPGHRGVDLAAAAAQRVYSAGAGRVAFAGPVAGRPLVSVEHAQGLRTTYEPVEPAVARGDTVTAGQLLGTVSAAAGHCVPATCLHWGLRRGETYLDPLGLLGAAEVRLLPVWSHGPATGPPRGLEPGGPADLNRPSQVGAEPGIPDRGPLLAGP